MNKAGVETGEIQEDLVGERSGRPGERSGRPDSAFEDKIHSYEMKIADMAKKINLGPIKVPIWYNYAALAFICISLLIALYREDLLNVIFY